MTGTDHNGRDPFVRWIQRQTERASATTEFVVAVLRLASAAAAIGILGVTLFVVAADPSSVTTPSSVAPAAGLLGFGLSLIAWSLRSRRSERLDGPSAWGSSSSGAASSRERSDE